MGAVSSERGGRRGPPWRKVDESMRRETERPCFATWTLLSNGPSIAELTMDDMPAGPPIIAVNHAVMHESIRADVWAVHEDHSGIREGLHLKAEGPDGERLGETWVASGHLKNWRGHLAKERKRRGLPELDLLAHPNRTNDWSYRNLPWPGSQVRWGDRTVFAAIGHAVMRGATVIHCYGVDMVGAHNFSQETCSEEQRRTRGRSSCTDWHERWAFERAQWDLMVEEARAAKIQISREGPPA